MTKIESAISPDNDSVVTEIEIAAPPERVFHALIDREQALQWGKSEAFEMTLWEMDARPGGKWRFISKPRTGDAAAPDLDHHGEILEIDPPRLLAYSWYASWHQNPAVRTVVRWELTPTKLGTHLKVVHSGLLPLPGACQGYSQGWPGLLQSLKNVLEK
ncbi:MAG: SRPBCC domain-containing protein [Candidatus Sulfotelmatobacter sp.]